MIDDDSPESNSLAVQRSINQAFQETLEAMTEAIEGLERRVSRIERFLYNATKSHTQDTQPCPPKTKPSSSES